MQTTQDAPAEFIFKLWPKLEANKNKIIGGVIAVVAVIAIYNFIGAQREAKEKSAGEALTALLMTPPNGTSPGDALAKFAKDFDGTQAAQRAQLQAAAAFFGSGKFADAQAGFEKFLANSPGGALAATAQLGVAASLEAQGKADLASEAYRKTASNYSGQPAALPALVGLGRLAEQAGKLPDALTSYDAAAKAGQAGGSLAQEAAMRAAEIRAKMPAPVKAVAPAAVTPVVAPAAVKPAAPAAK